MLDTHGRKYVNPLIDVGANLFLKFGLKPNTITIFALLLGFIVFGLILINKSIFAVIVLWISGYLDAVDGAMARKLNCSSAKGTLMDITFDRVVEALIIIGIAIRVEEARLSLIILTICILLSMTIFLTVGALTDKKGMKSFYYQAGLAERTEGFIMFSLMILLQNHISYITYIFAFLVIFTAFQRMREAYKILN